MEATAFLLGFLSIPFLVLFVPRSLEDPARRRIVFFVAVFLAMLAGCSFYFVCRRQNVYTFLFCPLYDLGCYELLSLIFTRLCGRPPRLLFNEWRLRSGFTGDRVFSLLVFLAMLVLPWLLLWLWVS